MNHIHCDYCGALIREGDYYDDRGTESWCLTCSDREFESRFTEEYTPLKRRWWGRFSGCLPAFGAVVVCMVIGAVVGAAFVWGLDRQLQDHDAVIQAIERGEMDDHVFDM